MVIADGNLRYAIINAIRGHWTEVNKKCTYFFDLRNDDPNQPVVSVNFAPPVDLKISFEEGICFVEISKIKYKLWYRDNTKDIRLELHSTKSKLKLAKLS